MTADHEELGQHEELDAEVIEVDLTEAVPEAVTDAAVESEDEAESHEQAEEETALPEVVPSAETIRALEAILMVADQPVEPILLAQLLEFSPIVIDDLCVQLAEDYESGGRGFQLVRVAGGWRFQSHPDLAAYVERFALDGQVARLSGAALETLAIVAYKQPISRAQIAQIRGVNVDGVMRTLVQRGYVSEIGTDPGPGQATLFGTTKTFLESLGIDSVADLAPLADFVPGSEIMEALEAGLRVDLAPTDAATDLAADNAPTITVTEEARESGESSESAESAEPSESAESSEPTESLASDEHSVGSTHDE